MNFPNIQDEITFQMGLNLREYQEIEQRIKNLIHISSQTLHVISQINDKNKIFGEPQIDIWSNSANLEKTTLGNLFSQINLTENEPHYKKYQDDIDKIRCSFSYHIPLAEFFNMAELEEDFKQIVLDRNQFIHHFYRIGQTDDEILNFLQESYQRVLQFKNKHLMHGSQRVEICIQNQIDDLFKGSTKYVKLHFENWSRITAYSLFEAIYQKHKRKDDWAVWSVVMKEMQENHANILIVLRNESPFISKNTTWIKIVRDIFPKWQFKEEISIKGGKCLLVKMDNSVLKLKDNQIMEIGN